MKPPLLRERLTQQWRMITGISDFVKTIYIDLIDASTVADLPSVKGLVPNL